ncbi:SUN domain-containing protein 3-like [Gavia stellata]|uniref:SUN domain-containing protein 3-like n=1 Tax=Gavia stellata TaxID=37040 RepID=UPI00289AFA35|nr:SUN domain-containing protein 3-like [Gavia stellata]
MPAKTGVRRRRAPPASRAELQDGAGGACCEAEGGEEGEDPAAIRRLPPEVTMHHPPEGQEGPEAPFPAASHPVWNSQAWLEQKMQELKETAAQVSAARANILQAVREVLRDHGVQEEKREEILQLTQAAIKNVLENYLPMPDWALEAIGATIEEERTSKSYGGQGKKSWWLSPFGFSSANPPETILQPRMAPGNCWAFQGSRGHVVIRLPEQIWPRAFTIWHISEAVSPSGEVSSAPKEFAVSGVDEAGAETLLGTFTYEVHKEVAQTFHVQKELPRTFRYIKFEVQSNWGNPEYTCVYRVQVHGKTASHHDHPQAQDLL